MKRKFSVTPVNASSEIQEQMYTIAVYLDGEYLGVLMKASDKYSDAYPNAWPESNIPVPKIYRMYLCDDIQSTSPRNIRLCYAWKDSKGPKTMITRITNEMHKCEKYLKTYSGVIELVTGCTDVAGTHYREVIVNGQLDGDRFIQEGGFADRVSFEVEASDYFSKFTEEYAQTRAPFWKQYQAPNR